MLFVQLEDTSGECEVIVFPRTLAENAAVWTEGANLAVTGRMSLKDDERKIIADRGWPLTDETKEIYKKHFKGEAVSVDELVADKPKPPAGPGEVQVMVPDRMSLTTTDALKSAFAKYPGNIKVCLQVKSDAGTKRIETSYRLDPTSDALRAIETVIGFGNVKVIG